MKNLFILISILTTFYSCQETPQAKFNKHGVSLTSPKGWEITEEETLDDLGYYLSLEKDGLNYSGIMTVSWVNMELDIDDWIQIHKAEMSNNTIYKNSKLEFGTKQKSTFNNIETTSLSYKANILGVKHEGTLNFFYKNEKSFSILIQEAIEDKAKNKSGFHFIEQSFNVE